jgi:EpsI family protein
LCFATAASAWAGADERKFIREGMTEGEVMMKIGRPDAESTDSGGGAKVSVHVYYYRKQSQGGKLASSQNILVLPEDSVWNPMPLAVATTSLDGAEVRWRATHMLRRAALTANTRQHLVVWQSYWVDDQFTPSAIGAKLHGARGLLAGRGDDGGGQLLSDFAQAQLPALRDALRRTRDER